MDFFIQHSFGFAQCDGDCRILLAAPVDANPLGNLYRLQTEKKINASESNMKMNVSDTILMDFMNDTCCASRSRVNECDENCQKFDEMTKIAQNVFFHRSWAFNKIKFTKDLSSSNVIQYPYRRFTAVKIFRQTSGA